MRVAVLIPGLLRSYTNGAARVELEIAPDSAGQVSLGGILAALDARYRGLAFRVVDEQRAIRPHVRMFVNTIQARALDLPIPPDAEIMIVGALSGG